MTPRPVSSLSKPVPPGVDARRRGSVLILSVVIVVLMAMMGAAYLQMARSDRASTQLADNRSGQDFEPSILRWIAKQIAADGVDPSTRINIDAGTLDQPANDEEFLDDVEPYDFPWTNPTTFVNRAEGSAAGAGTQIEGTSDLDTSVPATIRDPQNRRNFNPPVEAYSEGGGEGAGDDMWLASIQPDFSGFFPAQGTAGPFNAPDPYWPHITNLRGVWLDMRITRGGSATGLVTVDGARLPRQYLSTTENANQDPFFGDLETGDTNLNFEDMQLSLVNEGDRLFADADGDGIADSKWTWAPLPEANGLRYVMAVRIVDNSAKADVNTWHAMSGTAGFAGSNDALPGWRWPGDLDLFPTMASAPNGGDAVLDDILTFRRTTNNPNDHTTRNDNWRQASRLYGVTNGTYERFKLSGDAELAWRNGLNRSSDNQVPDPPSTLETQTQTAWGATDFWRQGRLESDYVDLVGYNNDPTSRQRFFEEEGRKRITLLSGSADYERVNLDTDSELKIANHFQNLAREFPPAQTGPGEMAVYDGPNEFGYRLAAVLEDFKDQDNTLTRLQTTDSNGNDVDVFGMEYLPFISEVYVQARYRVNVGLANPPDPVNPNAVDVTLELVDDADIDAGIELVNPWPWTIALPAIELEVGDGNDWGNVQDRLSAASLPAEDELDGDGLYTIRHEDPGQSLTLDYGANSESVPSPGTDQVWPVTTGSNGQSIPIRLRVNIDGGGSIVYQQFTGWSPADSFTVGRFDSAADAADPANPVQYVDGATAYAMFSYKGTGNGLNVMTVRSIDVDTETLHETSGSNQFPTVEADLPAGAPDVDFGNANKTKTSAADGDILDTRVQDARNSGAANVSGAEPWLIGNEDEVLRAGDLFRLVLLGPRVDTSSGSAVTQTVAEVWHEAAANLSNAGASRPTNFMPTRSTRGGKEFWIQDFMIDPVEEYPGFGDFGPSRFAYANSGTGNLWNRVSYGVYFLGKSTTLSPDNDNLDNDRDGTIDDADENLIPGRINLNTASRDLLARALPMPPVVDRYANLGPTEPKKRLIDAIVAGRNNPLTLDSAATARNKNPNGASSANRTGPQQGLAYVGELMGDTVFNSNNRYGILNDPSTAGILGVLPDFNEYQPGTGAAGTNHTTDNSTEDREELTLGLSYLNQVASTRSDVFTIYIHVKGFPANDFSQDPVENYRLVAVMDRSVINASRPLPRLTAVARFEQDSP